MALSQFNDELRQAIEEGLVSLFNWIHSNPTASSATAKAVVKQWLDANYPQFATQTFGDNLVSRLLYLADGSWVGFRTLVLSYQPFLGTLFSADVVDGLRSPGEMLHDWLLENGGVYSNVLDSSGLEEKRNFKLSEELTDGTYTVRQNFNPTFDGKRTHPNPLGWEVV